MTTWQVQTAKQRFSEVLRAVETGEPQFITKHGRTVAVVIDIEEYRRSQTPTQTLSEFLLTARDAVGLEEDLEIPPRVTEPDRAHDLFGDEE